MINPDCAIQRFHIILQALILYNQALLSQR
jgi:hypothetical protein